MKPPMLHQCWRVIRQKAASRHLWEVWFLWAVCVSSSAVFRGGLHWGIQWKPLNLSCCCLPGCLEKHPGRVKEGNTEKKKKRERWTALFWCEARARCHSQIPRWERSFHQRRLSPPYLTPSCLKKIIPLPVEPSRVTWRQCKQKEQVVLVDACKEHSNGGEKEIKRPASKWEVFLAVWELLGMALTSGF